MTQESVATAQLRTARFQEVAAGTVLRCPSCQCELGHHDRKGGYGIVLRNRYVRVVPEERRILLACVECREEIEFVAGRLVVEKRVAG
ncbi:MAG TPA: hypothetical protein VMW56_15570 [Candidatus Margulisiibacteriota bacterium]|nr:hypothetical protein [Candidatus Margulisiibacteriota bacterium]